MSDSDSSLELHDIEFDEDFMIFETHDRLTFSPQLQAAVEDDVERLRSLLQQGKSVNINDYEGNTPLHLAVKHQKRNAFEYLLTVDDVRLDAENFESYTPLMLAVTLSDNHYAFRLLEHDVEVNTVCPLENTPLHFAVEADNAAMVEALLQHGAQVNCQNVHGETPLHLACKRHRSLIHLLLYYGADAKIDDSRQETPFYLGLLHCSSLIQEILYNYTYDDLSSEIIDMKTLILVMKEDSWFFYRLIKRNRVVCDSDGFKLLNDNMYLMKPSIFKAFIVRYDSVAEEFFNEYNPIDTFNYKYPTIGPFCPFFPFFYMLCETRFIQGIVETSVRTKMIVSRMRYITRERAIGFLCCLYSYGFTAPIGVFSECFWAWGGSESFSYLLHMEIDPINSYERLLEHRPEAIIPILILDVKASTDLLYLLERIKPEYFTKLRKLFRHSVTVQYERKLMRRRGVQVSSVPSLVQLSRDAARKALIQKFKIKNNVQFFTMLKALPVAQIYKDILSYRKSIYEIDEKKANDETTGTDSESESESE